MELVSQHTKAIMEGCKRRARDAGLDFQDETLEYIVTNRDLIELSPKVMIPTLYDYWVNDVEVLREKGKYELYPSNPYETVINTRPAVSFYNDNNPDWLNVMIFYHVLGHIDFFHNNLFFRHTWDYDFMGRALADKRAIARLRSEHGRWVDYVIEFARGIDNLVDFHGGLSRLHRSPESAMSPRLDYYFDVFLQQEIGVSISDYVKEIQRYNNCVRDWAKDGERHFFAEVDQTWPEFHTLFDKNLGGGNRREPDLIHFLMDNSDFINRRENLWMKDVLEIVHRTSVFFQPQIRTKIMNEGWASYWHETLFLEDNRIAGHEIDFARVNAAVTSLPRVGLNPYALGLRMFKHIEEEADRGRLTFEFERMRDARARHDFDRGTGAGRDYIFAVRENLNDFLFIRNFVDQDLADRHGLFVTGKRLDQERMVWQYYVKSRRAEDYRKMIVDQLYHPPSIAIDYEKTKDGLLRLDHLHEGKPLVRDFIANTMLGIEYLWGGPIEVETSDLLPAPSSEAAPAQLEWERVVYRMEDRKLNRAAV